MAQRRKNMSQKRNSPRQLLIGESGKFGFEGVWLIKPLNCLYRNCTSFNGLSIWFFERIYKQVCKLQQCVCQSKMPLHPWPGWKYNGPWAKSCTKAINKLAYAYHKQLGYISRHGLCSLLQCPHAWYSICFKQTMTSRANFKHWTYKGNGPAVAKKDKGKKQASNDNTRLNASIFS